MAGLTGVEVARRYYVELVRPLLDRRFPALPHAAARLGGGSDVLGCDDAVSRDHDWGLRLTLLVDMPYIAAVDAMLADELPSDFLGLPTRFTLTSDSTLRHRVQVETSSAFVASHLGVDGSTSPTPSEWLGMTGQALLEVTAGPVFADTARQFSAARDLLSWYPDDVWQYVIAADWAQFADELPLMSRAGSRGDDVGARVIAGRLIRRLLHLGMLLHRRWPPYAKWLGTAFASLPHADQALGPIRRALATDSWQERQAHLTNSAGVLYEVQRDMGLPCISTAPCQPFFGRPFLGLHPAVVDVLLAAISDPTVRALPAGLGAIEQWTDSVAVLTDARRRTAAVRAALG